MFFSPFQYPFFSVKANNIGKGTVLDLFVLKYEWFIKFGFFLPENLGGRERRESGRRRLKQGDYGCIEGKQ